MTTQAPTSSQNLASARELLDELQAVNHGTDNDSQTKAVTAAAYAVLVLAEQVAAIRVLMVEEVVARRADGQPDPQDNKTWKQRGRW